MRSFELEHAPSHLVQPLERVIRIRTGEQNNAALTPVTADRVRLAAQAAVVHAEE